MSFIEVACFFSASMVLVMVGIESGFGCGTDDDAASSLAGLNNVAAAAAVASAAVASAAVFAAVSTAAATFDVKRRFA